ncbi:hypothetical protein BDF14DRAFT_969571 [Spinellus fusiger]|nr:hypothetical protein BDF14DRAFT_969571 [Spinellus fusiger]
MGEHTLRMPPAKKHPVRHAKNSASDRESYLRQLVQEYTVTKHLNAKQEILANLGNFAYDPMNYGWLWKLNVVTLFLDALFNEDRLLREFGMGGLANICLDPRHHAYITSEPAFLHSIMACLYEESGKHTKTMLVNSMTLLMLMIDFSSQQVILTPKLQQRLHVLQQEYGSAQISVLASLFLEDYFRETQRNKGQGQTSVL